MNSPHSKSSTTTDDDDPVDVMLKKTGCVELHHKVQECFAEHHDWRKCQKEVKEFKLCMSGYSRDRPSKTSSLGIACGWLLRGNSSKLSPVRRLFSLKGNLVTGSRMPKTKMVLVVRNDLGMGNGKMASQCAHAALACFELVRGTDLADQWTAQGQPKVVVKLDKGEFGLLELQRHAHSLGVPCAVIRDAGKTQVMAGSATVLGLGPADSEKVDSISGHLKLL